MKIENESKRALFLALRALMEVDDDEMVRYGPISYHPEEGKCVCIATCDGKVDAIDIAIDGDHAEIASVSRMY